MKVLFTCGGTAGHINPAVALARMFQERNEGCEVLFVGARGGMEEKLVPKEGFPLKTVTINATKLKTVGKNAFKNIQKKATFKCPKKQKDAYKKLIKSNAPKNAKFE